MSFFQLSEYEREKIRRQDKKKKVITTRSQAVAATAVGVSWLTAGIATGGLVIAGTLVAAGVTVGSMGGTVRRSRLYSTGFRFSMYTSVKELTKVRVPIVVVCRKGATRSCLSSERLGGLFFFTISAETMVDSYIFCWVSFFFFNSIIIILRRMGKRRNLSSRYLHMLLCMVYRFLLCRRT